MKTFLFLLLVISCGGESPSPSAPSPQPGIKYFIPVITTNDTGGACPDGYLAKHVTMIFFQNGTPRHLVLECVSVGGMK